MIWTEKPLTCPDCGREGKMQLVINGETPVRYCPFCGCIRESHSWYKEVGHEEALSIIETRKPLGLFVEDTGVEIIGIDNSDGSAWTEEFPDRLECLSWLLQEGEEDERSVR